MRERNPKSIEQATHLARAETTLQRTNTALPIVGAADFGRRAQSLIDNTEQFAGTGSNNGGEQGLAEVGNPAPAW